MIPEGTKSRLYLVVIAMLLLVIAAMAFKVIVVGATIKAPDGRAAILFTPDERALMLGEMREFVRGVQRIADALSREDMSGVATAARAIGMARSHDVPLSMLAKLPLGFKTIAFDVHRGFDTMAVDAETLRMPKHTLGQLSDILQECVACHAAYQVSDAAAQ